MRRHVVVRLAVFALVSSVAVRAYALPAPPALRFVGATPAGNALVTTTSVSVQVDGSCTFDVATLAVTLLAYERLGRLDRAAELLRGVVADHPDEPNRWALQQQLARVEARLAAAR
jgi:hypothetical protein